MKVLLDTNIVIHREAYKVSHLLVGQLFNWLNRTKTDQYIHQITIDEISRHHNPDTLRSMGVKLEAYQHITTLAPRDPRITTIMSDQDFSDNDQNDSLLLNELVTDRVDFLITEDKKIHRKAEQLGVSERVFKIGAFVDKMMAEHPELINYKVLAVRKMKFGEIDVKNEFFDSFRQDYPQFDKWFTKKFDEPVYASFFDSLLVGFLYLKVEDVNEPYYDIVPAFTPKKRLKIGTLKVAINGYRIGERFLKIIFDNAIKQQVDEIYVTIFDHTPEQIRLIELIEDWGFVLHGHKRTATGDEKVYSRKFERTANRVFPKITFPYVSKQAKVFIVPIYPDYHTELLPDSILNTESPKNFAEHEPHRNAISKVYISHSVERGLQPGDIIVFYRTGGFHHSVATTLGIVEKVHNPINSLEHLISICYKKTFFDRDGLAKFWNRYPSLKPFVVEFLYSYSFPKRPNLQRLIELGIIKNISSAPRGFTPLTQKQLFTLLKASQSNESIVVD